MGYYVMYWYLWYIVECPNQRKHVYLLKNYCFFLVKTFKILF
jgi:hypothetical protein